ncbi:MAG: hypothetical protein KAW12_31385 [Candidatus Aminicenantes bacterium]|nr:hypothetical protein [Candidatus Aminicenantes bacterium]
MNKSYDKNTKYNQHHLMTYHLAPHKKHVFFIPENELKVILISVKELEVKKEIKLEAPQFYKKMPVDFYTWKEYLKLPKNSFEIDLQKWKSAYCRINKVIIEDNYLVLQVRTRSEQLKKFALLFYNPETFKLEKTIYTDDLLLGSRNGKYYFFAGGDPAFDEVDDFTIHIYSFKRGVEE